MQRALLDRFDGRTPTADLEAWVATRFGETLPTRREAAAFVRDAVERWG